MEKNRLVFIVGVALITLGIVCRIFSLTETAHIWFFIIGGVLKSIYLFVAYKQGKYKPGFELLFLGSGFFILFLGLSLRNTNPESVFGNALIVKAIILKSIFVFLIIRKMREFRLLNTSNKLPQR